MSPSRHWLRLLIASVCKIFATYSRYSLSNSNLAYILNLQGADIPYNPLFHAYLFVGLNRAILFLEPQKLELEVVDYFNSIGVDQRSYTHVWPFLRRREWGDGRVLIAPQTSYAISPSSDTPFRLHTSNMSIKNETEIECLKRAYLRDGVLFVRFMAWLETKKGYDITKYEAAWRLTEYQRKNKNFMGLAYENIFLCQWGKCGTSALFT